MKKKLALLIILALFCLSACGQAAEKQSVHKSGLLSLITGQEAAPDMNYDGQVGWLTFDGTDIDAPVMQSTDNDYFLRRAENGSADVWGCYFMDYECTSESSNLIIYGHSLEDDPNAARFSQLKHLLEEDFAKRHHTLRLYYNGAWNEYEVISAGYADAEKDRLAIVANPSIGVREQILALATDRNEAALSNETAKTTLRDHLLTLCTCTADGNTRFVVTAVRK